MRNQEKTMPFIVIVLLIFQSAFAQVVSQIKVAAKTKSDTYLLSEPSHLSTKIISIPRNSQIEILEYDNTFYKAIYNDKVGFIWEYYVQNDSTLEAFKSLEVLKARKKQEIRKNIIATKLDLPRAGADEVAIEFVYNPSDSTFGVSAFLAGIKSDTILWRRRFPLQKDINRPNTSVFCKGQTIELYSQYPLTATTCIQTFSWDGDTLKFVSIRCKDPVFQSKVDSLVDDGFYFKTGSTKSEIIKTLGKPLQIETEQTTNTDTGEKEKWTTLSYEGLQFFIYHAVAEKTEILHAISLTNRNYKLKYDVKIGMSRDELIKVLGGSYEPMEIDNENQLLAYLHSEGAESGQIIFLITKGIVSKIEWHYYLD